MLTFSPSEPARPIVDRLGDKIKDNCRPMLDRTMTYYVISSFLGGTCLSVLLTRTNPGIGTASVDNKDIISGRAADPDRGGIYQGWDVTIIGSVMDVMKRSEQTSISGINGIVNSMRVFGKINVAVTVSVAVIVSLTEIAMTVIVIAIVTTAQAGVTTTVTGVMIVTIARHGTAPTELW